MGSGSFVAVGGEAMDERALAAALRNTIGRRELLRLIQRVTDQQAQIAALSAALTAVNAKTQRVGTTLSGIAVGSQDVTLSWPTPWPDTFYLVAPTIISGTGALGALHVTLKTKTTTDVTVTLAATAVIASAAIDILGVRT